MDFRRPVVLDASAFYAGVPFAGWGSAPGASYVTTPDVYDEVSHIKRGHGALDALIASGRLSLARPAPARMDEARRAAEATGDMPNLSGPDVSAIALCMQAGLGIVTDDYAVSNVVRSLNLGVTPVMTQGISAVMKWLYYCPGCSYEGAGDAVRAVDGGGRGGIRGRHVKGGTAPSDGSGSKRGRVECPSCGTALKRRALKRSAAK